MTVSVSMHRLFVQAAILLLLCTASTFAQNTTQPARDDGVQRTLQTDGRIAVTDGGSLSSGISNVLVDRWGQCRWLDNNSADDYFVPTGNASDWQAFIDNAPGTVRVDRCCPARSVDLTSSDGQIFTVHLSTGRENSTGALGRQNLSHVFTVVRPLDGATWNETVSAEYVCQSGAWTNTSNTVSGGPGGWVAGAWSACSAGCDGTQTRSVTCQDTVGHVVADVICGANKPDSVQDCNVGLCPPDPCEGICTGQVGVCGNGAPVQPGMSNSLHTACGGGSSEWPLCFCSNPPTDPGSCTLGEEIQFTGFYLSSEGACQISGIWPSYLSNYKSLPECTPGQTTSTTGRSCITRFKVRDTRPMGNMGPLPWWCQILGRSCSTGTPGPGTFEEPIQQNQS